MDTYFLGIDVGATTMKSALVQADGALCSEVKVIALGPKTNNAAFLQALQESIVFNARSKSFDGIGIGSPGPLDDEKGIIFNSANFPLVKNISLYAAASEAWRKADNDNTQKQDRWLAKKKKNYNNIFLQNDANCAALGQFHFGELSRSRQTKNLAVYTLGTGVGGGLVYNAKLFKGYQGNAFEIGHTSCPDLALLYHNPNLRFSAAQKCGCGAWDCLETFSSARGLHKRYLSLLSEDEKKQTGNISVKDIAELARKQDGRAKKVFQAAGLMLGHSLVDMVHLLNIEEVIFTGGMAAAKDLLLPFILQAIQNNMFTVFRERLHVSFIPAQEQSGIKGAAALCLDAEALVQ